jgi:dCMP deaminase
MMRSAMENKKVKNSIKKNVTHSKSGDKVVVLIAYVPVLHEGYRRLFEKHLEAKKLFLIGPEIVKDFVPLTKDLRALPANMMREAIDALHLFDLVKVIGYSDLKQLTNSSAKIVMPDEDVMHELCEKYLPNVPVVFDSIFLRWDKHRSTENKPVQADQTISSKDSDKKIIDLLRKEAEKSSDWWRRIGAAIVKDGKIVLKAHNEHLPSSQMPFIDGDPRSDFHKGVNLELSTAIHTEARLVAEAAQKGICLEGSSLYVTTFPCPPCAKMIAYSGIKEIYYADGYGVLDGERVLKNKGVKIIFVKMK